VEEFERTKRAMDDATRLQMEKSRDALLKRRKEAKKGARDSSNDHDGGHDDDEGVDGDGDGAVVSQEQQRLFQTSKLIIVFDDVCDSQYILFHAIDMVATSHHHHHCRHHYTYHHRYQQ